MKFVSLKSEITMDYSTKIILGGMIASIVVCCAYWLVFGSQNKESGSMTGNKGDDDKYYSFGPQSGVDYSSSWRGPDDPGGSMDI